MKDEIKKTDIRVPSQALSSPPRFREWLLHQEVQGSCSFVGGQAELDELIRKLSPKPTLAEVLTLLQEGVSREGAKGAKGEEARGDARPTGEDLNTQTPKHPNTQTPKTGEGRQGMEPWQELLAAPPRAVILNDGTRVVLAHVEMYRPVGLTIEFQVNASPRAVVAGFPSMERREAALIWLDVHFEMRKL